MKNVGNPKQLPQSLLDGTITCSIIATVIGEGGAVVHWQLALLTAF